MQTADIPAKIPSPFGELASSGFIQNPVPSITTVPGRASWQIGFPPLTMEPIASGGIPPFGQDMNGILFGISAWTVWMNAGGPVAYDSAFSTIIGGYPKGALLFSADNLGWWLSITDNNVTNPDAAGAGWTRVSIQQVRAGNPNGFVAGFAATSTSAPTMVWDSSAGVFWICTTTGNAGAAVWAPLTDLQPVSAITGANRTYTAADQGQVYNRSNSGTAMGDTLPAVNGVENGWHVDIYNADATANLVITAPSGCSLQGVSLGTLTLSPGQNVQITADGAGGYWETVQPIPRLFASQAIAINVTGVYVPGVYNIDTTAAGFTFGLETGGVNGDNYQIRDVGGQLAKNNCILDPGSRTIMGTPGLFPLDVNWIDFVLYLKSGDWSLS